MAHQAVTKAKAKKPGPDAGKERLRKIAAIRKDPLKWFQGFGYYRHEQTRQPTRSKANVLQRRMFAHYRHCQEDNIPCRMVVCKYRRAGSSTGGEAMTYMHALNHYARLGVIGQDYRASSNMLEMLKFFGEHDDFPGWSTKEGGARPMVTAEQKVGWEEWYDESEWESVPLAKRVDRIIATKVSFKHDSEVELYTAKNSTAARSAGLQGYHATEVAHWPKDGVHDASETLKAMRNTLPKEGFHFALEESTANGANGEFYDTVMQSRWPESPWTEQYRTIFPLSEQRFGKNLQYVFIFAAWFEDERHVPDSPLSAEDEAFIKANLDDDEKALISRFGQDGPRGQRLGSEVNATIWEQLAWRRGVIANVCGKQGVGSFKQEYPSDPKEAFQASGMAALCPDGLMVLEEMCRGEVPEYGQLSPQRGMVTGLHGLLPWEVSFDRCAAGEAWLHVWEQPMEGLSYLVSADCMAGAEKFSRPGEKDRHSVLVWRQAYRDTQGGWHRTRLVARIRPPCQIEGKVLDLQVFLLCTFYGGALLVPEVHAGYGTELGRSMLEMGIPVYQRQNIGTVTQRTSLTLGWDTNDVTRFTMDSTLQRYVREQIVKLHCPHVVNELSTLINDEKGKLKGSGSNHDDDPMSMAIGLTNINQARVYPSRPAVRRRAPDEDRWRGRTI